MHSQYDDDDEADCGEAQPVFVVSPANKKELRISSEGRCRWIRSLVFLNNLYPLLHQLLTEFF